MLLRKKDARVLDRFILFMSGHRRSSCASIVDQVVDTTLAGDFSNSLHCCLHKVLAEWECCNMWLQSHRLCESDR